MTTQQRIDYLSPEQKIIVCQGVTSIMEKLIKIGLETKFKPMFNMHGHVSYFEFKLIASAKNYTQDIYTREICMHPTCGKEVGEFMSHFTGKIKDYLKELEQYLNSEKLYQWVVDYKNEKFMAHCHCTFPEDQEAEAHKYAEQVSEVFDEVVVPEKVLLQKRVRL